MSEEIKFPDNFLWGAASSSFQIEGAWNADGKGESIWDRFNHTPGKIQDGDTGDIACDHYHRYLEDINLMKEIGIKSYRLSVSWPRILPQGKGSVNQNGLDFYNRLVDGLLDAGITPMITLYHWDLPQALDDIGGWMNRDVTDYFADYASIMYKNLGDRVPLWMTHNEPWVTAFMGYWLGVHAPGIKDMNKAIQVSHNLLLSHGKAVQVFRSQNIKGKIGIALNIAYNYPDSDSEEDKAAAWLSDGYLSRWFLDPLFKGKYPEDVVDFYKTKGVDTTALKKEDLKIINTSMDYLAYNYYFSDFIKAEKEFGFKNVGKEKPGKKTAMGWPIHPEGLYDFLIRTKKDYGDIDLYISENGAAYNDTISADGRVHDEERIDYVRAHLEVLNRAIKDGVALKGYYLWSIMDNFEWAHGYSKRFGIIYVDYKTLKRTIKNSAYWYGNVIRSNILT